MQSKSCFRFILGINRMGTGHDNYATLRPLPSELDIGAGY